MVQFILELPRELSEMVKKSWFSMELVLNNGMMAENMKETLEMAS